RLQPGKLDRRAAPRRRGKPRPTPPGAWGVTPASPPQRPDLDSAAARAVAPPSAERRYSSPKAELSTRTWAPSFKSQGPHPPILSPCYHGFLMVERRSYHRARSMNLG